MTDTSDLRKQIVSTIISDINRGIFSPGEQLSQRRLRKIYGCGRWVAMKVLEELEASGWLDLTEDGTRLVAETTAGTLMQAVELRAVLEIYAVEKLVPMITEPFVKRLHDLNYQMWHACLDDDYEAVEGLNRTFHRCMVESVDEGPLSRQLAQLYQIKGFYDVANFSSEEQIFKSYSEHALIIDALETGDMERLRYHIRLHVVDNAEDWFG